MKIAIAGYGVEGKSNLRYFSKQPDVSITVVDERAELDDVPGGVATLTGEGAFEKLQDFDVVVRTAGLSPSKIVTNGKIWSGTNEFFARCPAPIIGVTGTKGKGTTCSLIASVLRSSGQKVHLVGNIGTPALDVLDAIEPSDVVVYELSSFQLWDLTKSPALAVVVMIEPDHLDVHENFTEYLSAKSHIVSHQSEQDLVIYHPTNEFSAQIAAQSPGKRVRYAVPDDGQVYVKENTFFVQDTVICGTDALQIPGVFNQENACAAISAALAAGAKIEFVEAGLRSFNGLPHRLKFVREVDGVRYFDDSIATTPGSATAALGALPGAKVIILGGSDKGGDYHDVVEACKRANASVIAIGQTGERIAALCQELGVDVVRETGGMRAVVKAAKVVAEQGGTVILSPASASFDQYKSYSDRGDQFVAAVEELS